MEAFVFNEVKGESGIRRNTNWMIFAVSTFVLLLYQLSDIVRVRQKKKSKQITEGKDTEKRLAGKKFLAFHAKLKFILLLIFLEMFKNKKEKGKLLFIFKFP